MANTHSNIEILNLVAVALAKGCAEESDAVIPEAWRAMDNAFEAGRQRGHEVGFNEGYRLALSQLEAAWDDAGQTINQQRRAA